MFIHFHDSTEARATTAARGRLPLFGASNRSKRAALTALTALTPEIEAASPRLLNKTYAATPSALRIELWKWTSDGSLRP